MFSLSRDVTVTDVETGVVLLDGRRGRYWRLNHSGAAVLRSLLEGKSPAETADQLRGDAAIPVEQALHDVTATIDLLRKARLLSVGVR